MISTCEAVGDASTLAFLERLPLFADLSPAELNEISWCLSPFACTAGERLFRQGDLGDTLYCVESGRIALTLRAPGGIDIDLREVGPGEVLGEMALLDSGRRSATATALEPTFGYALSAAGFSAVRAALRPSGFKVLRRLATQLAIRLRAHAERSPGGDPVRIDACAGGSGEDMPVLVRSPARELDRRNLMLFPAFCDFSADELDEVLRTASVLTLPRGHVVFREGDAPGSCFVVIRGAVLVCVGRGGQQRKVAVEGPGGIVGHLALIAPGSRSATCVTRERTVLLEIDRTTFDGMFDSTSRAAFRFFAAITELLSGELRRVDRRAGLI